MVQHKFRDQPLRTKAEISARIKELGAQISRDFNQSELVMVGVMKGAFIFLADLVREISGPRLQIDFITARSYVGTTSSGQVKIVHDLNTDIKGKDVILVEDVVDTGETMQHLLDLLKAREPKSLKVCTLLSKPESHNLRIHLDYVGFEISNEFVVGYGMDLDGYLRELPDIAVMQA